MSERMIRCLFLLLLSCMLWIPASADTETYQAKPFNKEKWEEISSGLDYSESAKEKPKKADVHEKTQRYSIPGMSVLIQYIGFALIIVIIGFICAKIITSMLNKNARVKNSPVHITSEDELQEENISEWPLQQILNKYMHDGDIRNAIRIYYLMSLQLLHLNGFITWEKDKTNSKYLMELSANAFVADFSALTHIYETTWYGKYIPGDAAFAVIKNQFTMFNNQFPKPDAK